LPRHCDRGEAIPVMQTPDNGGAVPAAEATKLWIKDGQLLQKLIFRSIARTAVRIFCEF
jgi:hypothetical protein